MITDIEKWCHEEAESTCCEITLVSGLPVRHDTNADTYEVAFKTTGQRGVQFVCITLDAGALRHAAKSDAAESLVRAEALHACERLRSIAMVPANVPIMGLGCLCPVHSAPVIAIDREAWTYNCTVETMHPLPDRVCLGHFVERRPK